FACGHTIEGVKFTIAPDLRERRVDEYGTHVVELIAQGDSVDVKATFVEKTLLVIQTVYQMSYGAISSTVVGIGKRPGGVSRDHAGMLVLHPLDGIGTDDDVTFYNAAVAGSGEVDFGMIGGDRTFECRFRCLIDVTRTNGNLIGCIGVSPPDDEPP